MQRKPFIKLLGVVALLLFTYSVKASDIGTGIDSAAGAVKNIFGNVSNLVLMIGAVVGLVGGIRVYIKWQNQEQNVQQHIVGWMGACIFILLSGTILKTMFGL